MSRALVFFLLFASACLHRAAKPTELLEEAEADAQQPGASPRTLALAGFHAWLTRNEPQTAQSRFAAAVLKEPREPLALYGQVLLALRSAQPSEAVTHALDLCERAPRHPLCASAARVVFDAAGMATSLDAFIVSRAPGVLAQGASADASSLLRAALANIHLARREQAQHQAIIKAQGVPTTATLMGPFSAYHLLELDRPTPVEASGNLVPTQGANGQVLLRELHFADGRFSLSGEPAAGDVYVLAVDFKCERADTYVVRTVTGMDHVALLDGSELLARRSWERPASTVTAVGVKLRPGTHRLLMRVAKEDAQGHLYFSVSRLDGTPAELTFTAAAGPPPSPWRSGSVEPLRGAQGLYPTAQAFVAALEDELGPALAHFIAATDTVTRDRDGAKASLEHLPRDFGGAAVRALQARVAAGDRTVPKKVAKGRATRDLEAAVELDKGHIAALLDSAQSVLDDNRAIDALEQLALIRTVAKPPPPELLMLEARAHLALGVDAQAALTAQQAHTALEGLCEAMVLRYDLAVRRDALGEQAEMLEMLKQCPDSIGREAEAAKTRGQLQRAAQLYEELMQSDQSHLPVATALANLYLSLRRFDDAHALLQRMHRLWPRNSGVLRQWAEVWEHQGNDAEALAARERALLLDGGDLVTRRTVERTRSGKELLAERAISTEEALKAYAAAPGDEDAPGAYVLDAAAVKVFPDGSMVDRIHIVQKVLDQSGIQDIAEVELPQGATVLKMRTLKSDGRVLEPESIDGKDTVSLPGVEVGDFIEYEYLLAHSPRGPAQPGFTSASFYFQIARQPNNWSTYTVVAPADMGMKVDAHNMQAPPPERKGTEDVFFHEERRVPPYIPEPSGPPSGNEWLPYVTVGAGQTGNDGVVTAYADAFMDLGQVTHEVQAFARQAAAGKKGREAVAALHRAVMQRLSGRDAGLQSSAASSLAQERGSRLMLEYAALKALGFPVRLAAVRTFAVDPAPYLFPAEALLPYVCLRVELPEKQFVWLDTLFRFAPFGELPEAASGRDAFLLPEPGRPLQTLRTPPSRASNGKKITLKLELTEDGTLRGEGTETYLGFAASQLSEALESVPPDQREQALQSALSRYFGGAELSKLALDAKRDVGAPVTVKYSFNAERFARSEGKSLVFAQATFPALLGRRYLQLGSRRTPLFLDSAEDSTTVAELTLPEGYVLSGPLPEVKLACPYGAYTRNEKVTGRTVTIEEKYRIEMARVPPEEYETFGRFAGELDLIQGRELLAEKK